MSEQTVYLTRGDIGKLAKLTSMGVLHAEKRGELQAAARTRGGISLYKPEAVAAFLLARHQAGKGEQP